ncbi:hypothetical protein [Spirulina sp. 06S082]|uniref:hypothetical protein n=1 Tax=Spirulina sp. 06S082 TaxID=3110248 RepID=UPI002B1ED250|nr:hypothetical protein [Spirulina sp. 06S082]MEA5472494.1 hypothetical protein [Spirulina sp. 06S082]
MLNPAQVENAKTRLLLFLWDLDGLTTEVKRGELNKKLVRTREKSKDYQPIFEELQEIEAIAMTKKGRSEKVSLTEKGLQVLKGGLKSPSFIFKGNQVGTKVPNALLKWIRNIDESTPTIAPTPAIEPPLSPRLESYEGFQEMLLEVYHRLNKDYNLGHLVPIYQLRREIGEKVTRSHFNNWLVEMQAEDIVQLMAGEMPDMTPDKREDSLTLPSGAFRYYVKHLNP